MPNWLKHKNTHQKLILKLAILAITILTGTTFFSNALAIDDTATFEVLSISRQNGEVLQKKTTTNSELGDIDYYEIDYSQEPIIAHVKVYNIDVNKEYRIYDQTAHNIEYSGQEVNIELALYPTENTEYSSASIALNYFDGIDTWRISDSKKLYFLPANIGTKTIKLVSISQNNTPLTYNNGRFEVPRYDLPIKTVVKIGTLDENAASYSLSDGSNHSVTLAETDSNTTHEFETMPNIFSKESKLSIYLYGSNVDHQTIINEWLHINYTITDESFTELGDIIIDEIQQDNQILVPEDNNEYYATIRLNDSQPTQTRIHLTAAIDSFIYTISTNQETQEYSGAELKNGVEITGGSIIPHFSYENYSHTVQAYYQDGSILRPIRFEKYSYYDTSLSYYNTPEIKLEQGGGVIGKTLIVSPKYHNTNNPIAVTISNGHFKESSIQNITIKVYRRFDSSEVYTKTLTKTGTELNNGDTVIPLDGFVMSSSTLEQFEPDEERGTYEVRITTNEVEKSVASVIYTYNAHIMKPVSIVAEDKNIIAQNGVGLQWLGAARQSFYGQQVNRQAVSEAQSPKLYFAITPEEYYSSQEIDIPDDTIFSYVLYRKNGTLGMPERFKVSLNKDTDFSFIEQKTITGKELKDGLFSISLDDINDEEAYTYYFVLTQNNNVILSVINQMSFWTGPGITSITANASEKLYVLGASAYIAPINSSASVTINGKDFEQDKVYTVYPKSSTTVLCAVGEKPTNYLNGYFNKYNDHNELEYCQYDHSRFPETKTFTGKELNEGNAIITLPSYIEYLDSFCVDFGVKDSEENEYLSGSILINYKNITNLLEPKNNYIIENTSSLIKGITKQTSIENLRGNLELKNNNKIEVQNPDSSNGKIATGSVITIKDEYDRPIMDIKAIVVGDTDGDGDITTNDLAKERLHLSQRKLLQGIYKIAGSASGSDEITPTDLARMRLDLAGRKEMKQ